MKVFLKGVLATITGLLLVILIIVSILISVIYRQTTSDNYTLKDNTILHLNLAGVLKDKVEPNPIMEYLGFKEANEISLPEVRSAIKKAKENDKIKGIYIRAGLLSASNASLREIRNDLLDFKESGKFIVSYGDFYTQGCYYLASAGDKIILNPQGNIHLHGISASRRFYKNFLDKIGVEIQVIKVGTYKSAVEPYIQDKMSEANKEQVSSYIHDIWNTMASEISVSRKISMRELNTLADTLPLFREAEFIIKNEIADTLLYEADVKKYLAGLLQEDKPENIRLAGISHMKSVKFKEKKTPKDKIAILYADGSINSGKSSNDIHDQYYINQLAKLKDDKAVKAVVFRVNSPGGSAYASEQIWKAVTELKSEKPVVVSMGDYAASGGYYISCNASRIIAQPNTLTGSIGIYGIFPNMEGLTEKLGFRFDQVKTNRFSDFGDFTRPMQEDEKEILQEYINRGYDLFISRCAEGRNIPKDSIDKIAQGRVWTGNQAMEIGLVDDLGGIDKAVDVAAKLAKLENYSLKEYPVQKNYWQQLLSFKKDKIALQALKEYIGNDYYILKTIKEIRELKEQDFIQARMPLDFYIE